MNNSKYLFLYLKTGGGHLAPAKSIINYLNAKKNGEFDILLVDGLEKSNKIIKYLIEEGYRKSITKALWLFEFLYAIHKLKPIAYVTSCIVSFFVKSYLRKILIEKKPDKIVIFHFFLIKPVYELLEELKMNIPILTVVTDPFTAHPLWFLIKKQNFIVFSEELRKKLIEKKIDKNNIHVFPFIVDDKFSNVLPEEKIIEIKEKIGINNGLKTVLILGGGDGMPGGKKILNSIIKANLNINIILVCGRNNNLYTKAMKIKTKYKLNNLKIYGFINNVHEIINISDIVITKCGASTFMEILLSKKIPLIYKYIWEQEKGNLEYIVKNKLGIYEPKSSKIPFHLKNILFDSDLFNHLKSNIINTNIINGLEKVTLFILNFK